MSVKEFRKKLSEKRKLLKKNRKIVLQDSPSCSTQMFSKNLLSPSKTRNVLNRKAKSGIPIWKRMQLCRWTTMKSPKKSPKKAQVEKVKKVESPVYDFSKSCSSFTATNSAQESVKEGTDTNSSDQEENCQSEEKINEIPSKNSYVKDPCSSDSQEDSYFCGDSNNKCTKESKELNELPALNTSNHKNDHISQIDLDENIALFRKIKPKKKNNFKSLVKGGDFLPLSTHQSNHDQYVDKSGLLGEILECSFDSNTSFESLLSSDNNTSLAPMLDENEPVIELTPPPKSKLASSSGFIRVDRFRDTSELGYILFSLFSINGRIVIVCKINLMKVEFKQVQ